jgi:hypothetical protein
MTPTFNREELVRTLQAFEHWLDNRVEIWVDIIEMDGSVSERIYRGSFQASPDWPQRKRNRKNDA